MAPSCPKCRSPIPSSRPGLTVNCPRCGTPYKPAGRADPGPALRFLKLPLAGDLDMAVKQVLEQLRKAGVPAEFEEDYCRQFQFAAWGKVIYIPWTEKEFDLVLVTTFPWSPDNIRKVRDDLIGVARKAQEDGGEVRFRFASAQALPEPIEFAFGPHPRSAFERLGLIRGFASDPNEVVGASQAAAVGQAALGFVKAAFGKRIDVKNTYEVKTLERLVLDEFRRGTPPSRPLAKGAYIPGCSLLMIGTILGEIFRSSGKVKAVWKQSAAAAFGLAMDVVTLQGRMRPFAPVQAMMMLYESGESASVSTFSEELLGGSRR